MVTLLAYDDAVDIGGGRGRLAAPAAASLARVDAQLGRLADVNEAWRSPEKADANYAAWVAYQNGTGPKVSYALPASESIHCRGYAVDSDDWYSSAAAAVWRDNGWRQTARYPGTSKDEPWHGEYDPTLDNHRYETAAVSVTPLTPDPEIGDDDMPIHVFRESNNAHYTIIPAVMIKHVPDEANEGIALYTGQPVKDFFKGLSDADMVITMYDLGFPELQGKLESLPLNGGYYWSPRTNS